MTTQRLSKILVQDFGKSSRNFCILCVEPKFMLGKTTYIFVDWWSWIRIQINLYYIDTKPYCSAVSV